MGIFGTDGIRDRAGQGALSPGSVRRIGRALARYARRHAGGAPRIVLGRDPRPSGPALVADLARGMAAEGALVSDLGVLPTPAVAWIVAEEDHDLGVAVSASHNPEADNGIKPFARGGRKLRDVEEREIEADYARAPADAPPIAPGAASEGVAAYVRSTIDALSEDGDLGSWRLCVDVAAGAAGVTAPSVLAGLGASAEILHPPGSRAINDRCGTEHPEAWREAVRRLGAGAGLAFDGDGDRVLVADAAGEVLDGDAMLAILAVDAQRRGRLPGDVVVGTVMCNFGLEERLASLGIRLERVAVGDRNVAERMRALGAAFGAEPSGHVVLPRDGALIGDAVVAGVRVLQAASRSGRALADLRRETPRYPQVLKNVRVREKPPLEEVPAVSRAIREEAAALGGSGRVVVRYSGTESLLRIMAEGREQPAVERAVARIEAAVREALGG